jgi:hypothetical protein
VNGRTFPFDRTKIVALLDALNQLLSALISDLAFYAKPPSVTASASSSEVSLSAEPILGDVANIEVILAGKPFDLTYMSGSQGVVQSTWPYWSNLDGYTYTVESDLVGSASVSFPLQVEIMIYVPATRANLGAKTVLTAPPTASVTFPLQKL